MHGKVSEWIHKTSDDTSCLWEGDPEGWRDGWEGRKPHFQLKPFEF